MILKGKASGYVIHSVDANVLGMPHYFSELAKHWFADFEYFPCTVRLYPREPRRFKRSELQCTQRIMVRPKTVTRNLLARSKSTKPYGPNWLLDKGRYLLIFPPSESQTRKCLRFDLTQTEPADEPWGDFDGHQILEKVRFAVSVEKSGKSFVVGRYLSEEDSSVLVSISYASIREDDEMTITAHHTTIEVSASDDASELHQRAQRAAELDAVARDRRVLFLSFSEPTVRERFASLNISGGCRETRPYSV
jgi:hypothetical protein